MPPLHIKLGLMKQFVKDLNKESAAFKHLRKYFPKLSEAKIKAWVFIVPQIKMIINCEEFLKKLTTTERKVWNSFINVATGFLGNYKAPNHVDLDQELPRDEL